MQMQKKKDQQLEIEMDQSVRVAVGGMLAADVTGQGSDNAEMIMENALVGAANAKAGKGQKGKSTGRGRKPRSSGSSILTSDSPFIAATILPPLSEMVVGTIYQTKQSHPTPSTSTDPSPPALLTAPHSYIASTPTYAGTTGTSHASNHTTTYSPIQQQQPQQQQTHILSPSLPSHSDTNPTYPQHPHNTYLPSSFPHNTCTTQMQMQSQNSNSAYAPYYPNQYNQHQQPKPALPRLLPTAIMPSQHPPVTSMASVSSVTSSSSVSEADLVGSKRKRSGGEALEVKDIVTGTEAEKCKSRSGLGECVEKLSNLSTEEDEFKASSISESINGSSNTKRRRKMKAHLDVGVGVGVSEALEVIISDKEDGCHPHQNNQHFDYGRDEKQRTSSKESISLPSISSIIGAAASAAGSYNHYSSLSYQAGSQSPRSTHQHPYYYHHDSHSPYHPAHHHHYLHKYQDQHRNHPLSAMAMLATQAVEIAERQRSACA
jgi:hypothetical protein